MFQLLFPRGRMVLPIGKEAGGPQRWQREFSAFAAEYVWLSSQCLFHYYQLYWILTCVLTLRYVS